MKVWPLLHTTSTGADPKRLKFGESLSILLSPHGNTYSRENRTRVKFPQDRVGSVSFYNAGHLVVMGITTVRIRLQSRQARPVAYSRFHDLKDRF